VLTRVTVHLFATLKVNGYINDDMVNQVMAEKAAAAKLLMLATRTDADAAVDDDDDGPPPLVRSDFLFGGATARCSLRHGFFQHP
jgi:hypothetical protein